MDKVQLLDLSPQELEELSVELGEKKYRGKQIFKWLHKGVGDFDQMQNLPKQFREVLSEKTILQTVKIIEKYKSKIDGSIKYLFLLNDNNIIEGVFMKHNYGNTICISSQVGCRMGCRFCASTLDGLVRNLTPGEILGQVIAVNRDVQLNKNNNSVERNITNIVIMGSGEPLDNYDNIIKFLKLVNDPEGINISLRNISLSTSGLIDKIRGLADENLPVTLSVSLHAADNTTRQSIMPVANANSIDELIKACHYYVEKTGRRIIFEYILIHDVNDRIDQADMLSDLLRGLQCHVNLIPFNSVKERDYKAPGSSDIENFENELIKRHISVTVRKSMGSDINGACGQLRRKYISKKNKAF